MRPQSSPPTEPEAPARVHRPATRRASSPVPQKLEEGQQPTEAQTALGGMDKPARRLARAWGVRAPSPCSSRVAILPPLPPPAGEGWGEGSSPPASSTLGHVSAAQTPSTLEVHGVEWHRPRATDLCSERSVHPPVVSGRLPGVALQSPHRQRMRRREIPGGVRFITFSCRRRRPLLRVVQRALVVGQAGWEVSARPPAGRSLGAGRMGRLQVSPRRIDERSIDLSEQRSVAARRAC